MSRIGSWRLCLHHVGGRSGTSSFPVVPAFEHDFIRVLYDADVDCIPDAVQRNRASKADVRVVPYCLGATKAASELLITYDPFNSSLRPSNPVYHAYYSGRDPHVDYLFGEITRIVERRPVETVPLDELVESGIVEPPDFLSVDTEGTEYEVLQGACRALRSGVLGLVVEVELHELYQGQRMFGDVQQALARQGFDFVRFLHLGEWSPYRAPIGLRGEGVHTSGDALFLRRLDSFDGLAPNIEKLRKLAFIAFVFNQFEFGIHCLHAAGGAPGGARGRDEQPRPSYDAFLDELAEAVAVMPATFPPAFTERFSVAESKVRCEAEPPRAKPDSRLKAAARRIPWIFDPLRKARRKIDRAGRRAGAAAGALRAGLAGSRYSDVEKVLIKYALRDQAETLRRRRPR